MSFTVKSAVVDGDSLIVTMSDGEQELTTTFTGRVNVSLSLGSGAIASLNFYCQPFDQHRPVSLLDDPPVASPF